MTKKIDDFKIDTNIINRRITNKEALDLIKNASLLEIGKLARAKKSQHSLLIEILIIQMFVGLIVSFVLFLDMEKMKTLMF